MSKWERLVERLDEFRLNEEMDEFTWILDKSGTYTIRSMHRRQSFRGLLIKE
jgi:hypothetical protein